MAIEFECIACLSTLRVPDENAGKKARCPNCQTIVQIPGETPPSPPSNPYVDSGQGASNPYSNPNDPYGNAVKGNDFSRPASDISGAGGGAYQQYPVGGSQPGPESSNPYAVQTNINPRMNNDRAVLGRIKVAGIVMMVFNFLFLGFAVLSLIGSLIEFAERGNQENFGGIILCLVIVAGQGVGALGSFFMIAQKNHGIAVLGAFSTILTGVFCCCVPSIVGVYALVVLLDGRASAAMRRNS